MNNSSVMLGMGHGDHHFQPEIKVHTKHFHKGSEEMQRVGQTLNQIVFIASKNEQFSNYANSRVALDKLLQQAGIHLFSYFPWFYLNSFIAIYTLTSQSVQVPLNSSHFLQQL